MGTAVKIFLELFVPILFFLLLITQVLLPMFTPHLPFFWLFKKGAGKYISQSDVPPVTKEPSDLDKATNELTEELLKDADKLKNTKDKVDGTINKLKDAKDNSLNNLNTNN